MANQRVFVDLDLQSVNQLQNYRVHNVTTTERTSMSAQLTQTNTGLHVFDVTEGLPYYWTGIAWAAGVGGTGGVSQDLSIFELSHQFKIAQGAYYTEIGYNQDDTISTITTYTDSSKANKLFTKTISYNQGNIVLVTVTDETNLKTLVTSIDYSNSGSIINKTITII
jgi:hypothetical protein